MFVVGLTGGVGSGKSTVAEMLAKRGAVIIDADVLARDVVEPGNLGYDAIRARFGREVFDSDKLLDRAALASVVFSDDDALHDLNGIVHPLVREKVRDRLAELSDGDDVVVLVIPLLIESGQYSVEALIVVDSPESLAIARVTAQRGWTEKQALQRLDAQASRGDRRSAADLIIENVGTVNDLAAQVDRAWSWIRDRRSRS